jgi:NTE family protein
MPRNGSRAAGTAAPTQPQRTDAVPLGLALPGGGAYGAFAWGALDRLLEEPNLAFPVVSGASAGAVNAVALAAGWAEGGRAGARAKLTEVWERTAAFAAASPLQPWPLDRLAGPGSLDYSPGYRWLDTLSRLVSPYVFNPLDLNPLREVLRATIDFAAVRKSRDVRVYVAATNVRLGRIKVFGPDEIALETVLASTCLPFLNKAVEIDGEPYWDGAYLANPPLRPLAELPDAPGDLLLIELEGQRDGPPTGPQEIFDRLNGLSGEAGLLAELEWLAAAHPEVRLHGIAERELMGRLAASSRLNADRAFLHYLRDLGRDAAASWLAGPRALVGGRSGFAPPSRYL